MAGTTPAAKKRSGRKPVAATPFVSPGAYELSDDAKVSIFREYAEWVRDGRMHVDSPITKLMTDHGVGRQYPKRLYDKVLASGSVASKPRSGRPELFSPGCWEQMVGIIREFRTKQRVASTRSISSQLTRQRKKKKKVAPSKNSVHRAKKQLAFKKHKVATKPKLNAHLWATRLAMAKQRKCTSDAAYIKANARTVFADEKWHSEEKGRFLAFEARDDSPVPITVRFKEKDAETVTQRIKIMFLLCVTSTKAIGAYELDFKKWNKDTGAKTLASKPAKGITAAYLKKILKKVGTDARKILGPGPIKFLHDKAPVYGPCTKDAELLKLFDGGLEMAAGKAPDMSHLARPCARRDGERGREIGSDNA